ncbi:MAG: hypothetical protein HOV92_06650, partial [Streptomyces sp.]|nr:hypothetical protein [Streptomyces sp.]
TKIHGRSAPNEAIPEGVGGLTDAISLEGAGTVRDLTLSIDIEHGHIGDLRVVLLAPSGRRAVIHNRTGGATKNLRLTLTSDPPSLLAPLVGDAVAGDWKLKITDAAQPVAGTLLSWEITLHTGT